MPVLVLTLAFVISGAAGLIYEATWTRYLSLFVGHDAYAQILVLVIFLGGMAVGAWYGGRWGERLRSPLLAFAAVEGAAGVIGLLFHGFAVIVTLSIVASAFVSLTLVPMMASRFLSDETHKKPPGRIVHSFEVGFNKFLADASEFSAPKRSS